MLALRSGKGKIFLARQGSAGYDDFRLRLELMLSSGVQTVKRRELFRRAILGTVGAAVTSTLPSEAAAHLHFAREFPPNQDTSAELARSDWKPVFLDQHQNDTLILLSDLILPATDPRGERSPCQPIYRPVAGG
jgi:hypothetical protein